MEWLAACDLLQSSPHPVAPKLPTAPDGASFAVQIWNDCGCTIEWDALPYFADLYGIEDMDQVLIQLLAIREYARNNQDKGSS